MDGFFVTLAGALGTAAPTFSQLGLSRILATGLAPGQTEIERVVQWHWVELTTGVAVPLADVPPSVQLKVQLAGYGTDASIAGYHYKTFEARKDPPTALGIALSLWGIQGGASPRLVLAASIPPPLLPAWLCTRLLQRWGAHLAHSHAPTHRSRFSQNIWGYCDFRILHRGQRCL